MAYKKAPSKATKRTASSAAGRRVAKKPAVDQVAAKCGAVAAEIKKTEVLPASCRTMLSNAVKSYLSVYAESRHPYQTKSVEMVASALADIEAKLEEAIAQANIKVDSADAEKASRDGAVTNANTNLEVLEGKLKSAQETHAADKAAEEAAKAVLAAATQAVKDKDAEIEAAGANRAKLALVLEDGYVPLKESGKSCEGRKHLKALTKLLAGFDMEEELVKDLAETLVKAPGTRGTYDTLVIKHVDAQTAALLAKFEAAGKAAEAGKTEAVNTKAAAEAAHAAILEKLNNAETGSKPLLAASEKAKGDGKAGLAACVAAVKSYEKDMKEAAENLIKARVALRTFKEGPAQAFADLKDLAPPPPEPEPVEDQPEVATEAPVAMEA